MQPTFNTQGSGSCDALFLNKLSASRRTYERGDVIVLCSPSDPAELLTKRVIAMEGDLVYRRDAAREIVQVPRGHVWVEGDNKQNSNDSNAFGAVAEGLVQARVDFKLYPLSEAGVVQRKEPPRDRIVRMGRNVRSTDQSWWWFGK